MIVEIHGAGFRNKGAQLMLYTVLQRLRAELPGVVCCLEPGIDRPYEQVASYGLRQLFPAAPHERFRRFQLLFGLSRWVGPVLPKRWCDLYGLVRRHDPAAMMDISGYSFGDKWPLRHITHATARMKYYRRRNKPVILLPQMLGPFEKPGYARAFAQLVEQTTLVYARERISLQQAQKALKNGGDRIKMAPDITIFTQPDPQAAAQAQALPKPDVCLVPNVRVLDKAGEEWKSSYVPRLAAVGQKLRQRGLDVRLVVHEATRGDLQLAKDLLKQIGLSDQSLHLDDDPLRLKALLSQARFVVVSRFHSAVAALSTGVPAITLGWAHKYDMLLEDFGVPDLAHHAGDGEAKLMGLVDGLLDDAGWKSRHDTLVTAKQRMKPINEAMWAQVIGALKTAGGGAA